MIPSLTFTAVSDCAIVGTSLARVDCKVGKLHDVITLFVYLFTGGMIDLSMNNTNGQAAVAHTNGYQQATSPHPSHSPPRSSPQNNSNARPSLRVVIPPSHEAVVVSRRRHNDDDEEVTCRVTTLARSLSLFPPAPSSHSPSILHGHPIPFSHAKVFPHSGFGLKSSYLHILRAPIT